MIVPGDLVKYTGEKIDVYRYETGLVIGGPYEEHGVEFVRVDFTAHGYHNETIRTDELMVVGRATPVLPTTFA